MGTYKKMLFSGGGGGYIEKEEVWFIKIIKI